MAHDPVDLTLSQKIMKDVVVGLIFLHTGIMFHGDIKPRIILQCGSSCKVTDFPSSRKIDYVTHNSDKYNWGYCTPEFAVTLLNS